MENLFCFSASMSFTLNAITAYSKVFSWTRTAPTRSCTSNPTTQSCDDQVSQCSITRKKGRPGRIPGCFSRGLRATIATIRNLPKSTDVERANPSLKFVDGINSYVEQQRGRLPSHLFRRLHLNQGGQPQGAAFAAESILNAIATNVKVRPPVAGIDYAAAADMSDGSNDDATLAIGHLDQEARVVVDLLINQQCGTPFDPLRTVKLFAATAKPYQIHHVTLDRFAHNTFSSAFASYGITAVLSELLTRIKLTMRSAHA